jgi:hypothetical protein
VQDVVPDKSPFTKRDWEKAKLGGLAKQKMFNALFRMSSRINLPSLLLDIDLCFCGVFTQKNSSWTGMVLQLKSCILAICCQKRWCSYCDRIYHLSLLRCGRRPNGTRFWNFFQIALQLLTVVNNWNDNRENHPSTIKQWERSILCMIFEKSSIYDITHHKSDMMINELYLSLLSNGRGPIWT